MSKPDLRSVFFMSKHIPKMVNTYRAQLSKKKSDKR